MQAVAGPPHTSVDRYSAFIALDRAGWAWEWLRRNPAYRSDMSITGMAPADEGGVVKEAPGGCVIAARWGLHFRRGPLAPGDERAGLVARVD